MWWLECGYEHDASVRIWDVETGLQTDIWQVHTGDVWSVDWSEDGNRISSGAGSSSGKDRTVQIWDLE